MSILCCSNRLPFLFRFLSSRFHNTRIPFQWQIFLNFNKTSLKSELEVVLYLLRSFLAQRRELRNQRKKQQAAEGEQTLPWHSNISTRAGCLRQIAFSPFEMRSFLFAAGMRGRSSAFICTYTCAGINISTAGFLEIPVARNIKTREKKRVAHGG